MKITLDIDKTLEENAETYFNKAKKSRNKIPGAEEAIIKIEKKAAEADKTATTIEAQATLQKKPLQWFQKYHWGKTRNGHLLVAGTNAGSNETLVKHHTLPEDFVFHTDMAGSPFTILKPTGETKPEDFEDAARITACYSKAWSKKIAQIEVFHVKPEQVTKEAQAGEFLTKGAFMIRGETKYHQVPLELSIGVIEEEGYEPTIFVGTKESCEENTKKYRTIIPGDEKTSDIAKKLRKEFGGDLDKYIQAIPAGGSKIL